MKRIPLIIAVVAAAACGPAIVSSPSLRYSGAFVSTLGSDTVAFERYTRTAYSIEGELVHRYQGSRRFTYNGNIGPSGRLTSLNVVSRRLGSDLALSPAANVTMSIDDTVALIDVDRNGRRDTTIVRRRVVSGPVALSFPGLPPSYALYELMLGGRGPADSVAVSLQNSARGANPTMWIVRRGPNDYDFRNTWQPNWVERVRTDDSGRILEVNSTATTIGTMVRRVNDLALNTLIAAWTPPAAAPTRPVPLSPADTVRATIAGANLEIAYSRPSKRGRVVFGGDLVPWGKVWRLGANAATSLSTSRDLMIGNITVPAGRYTLFLLPVTTGAKLIINSQTGQWGTEYNIARDLTRVDLLQRRLASPVEQFTILAEPQGSGGILRMRWDTTEYSIPFSVK